MRYVNEYECMNYYNGLVRNYMKEDSKGPLTRVNTEFVRRINAVLEDMYVLKHAMLCVAYIVALDDTLEDSFREKKRLDCTKIATSLNKQMGFYRVLKTSLKTKGGLNQDLVKGISMSINNVNKRADRLSSSIMLEYMLLTKWRGYLDILNITGNSLIEDMKLIIPDLFALDTMDFEAGISEVYNKYARAYTQHIEGLIDVSNYQVEANKEVACAKAIIANNSKLTKQERLENLNKKKKWIAEDLDRFATKLEFTLRNGNRNNWLKPGEYEAVMSKAHNRTKKSYDECSIVVYCKIPKTDKKPKLYYANSYISGTSDISRARVFGNAKDLSYYVETLGDDVVYRVIYFDSGECQLSY